MGEMGMVGLAHLLPVRGGCPRGCWDIGPPCPRGSWGAGGGTRVWSPKRPFRFLISFPEMNLQEGKGQSNPGGQVHTQVPSSS